MITLCGCRLLGQKLRDCRISKGMTQSSLADGLITRNMISRIENGKALPSLDVLLKLASRLEISPGYLVDDSNDGEEKRRLSLLQMLTDEYSEGQYEACLNFCRAYGEDKAEISSISLDCYYNIGYSLLCSGKIKPAESMLKKLLALSQKARMPLWENETRGLLMLTSSLLSGKELPSEYEICKAVFSEKKKSSISAFCSFYCALTEHGKDILPLADLLVFSDTSSALAAKGLSERLIGNSETAAAHFTGALSHEILPHVRLICLTELEAISASGNDFANAYAYSRLRKEFVSAIREM